jgi:hypothetical protein
MKERNIMSNSLKEKLSAKVAALEPIEVIAESHDEQIVQVPNESSAVLSVVSVVPDFAITLAEAKERIKMLQSFVREMMTPGVDFGLIPNCTKPTLLKPGAEKLCDIFGFSKQVVVENRVEDWSVGFVHYEVKTVLISKRTGAIEAEGVGCCNSKERKYKTQDGFSIANTILKMAKKRSLVDAVLSATRSSDLFTQDIEDITLEPKPIKKAEPTKPAPVVITPINKQQLREIFSIVSQNAIAIERVKAILQTRYNVDASVKLTSEQAEDLKVQLKTLIA